MSINLSKGEGINLLEAPGIKQIGIGFKWKINQKYTGLVFDLDASVLMLGANGKIPNENYFVFYNNLESPDGSVKLLEDSTTGEGYRDDKTIEIDLSKVEPSVQEIVFVVTIYDAEDRKQNFGQLRNSFIRIYDKATEKQVAKYELDDDFSKETALEFGRLYKKDGNWSFQAVGQGYDSELQSFVDKYAS
jgi:tellurium resistance protein TerD